MAGVRQKEYVRRLRREFTQLAKEPVPNITTRPTEDNILVWYYVLEGHKDSPYKGGVYIGKLRFPSEYPHKPPSIFMLTPNGRFKPDTRLCLSMSDYHPESWNPLWSVGSILTGLQSFMLEDKATAGSINTSSYQKRRLARASMQFNLKQPIFTSLFPDIVEKYKDIKPLELSESQDESTTSSSSKLADIITIIVAIIVLIIAVYVYKTQ